MLNRQLNSCCWWTYKLEEMWKHHMIANNIFIPSKKFRNPLPNVVQHPVFRNWFFILISWSNFRNRYRKVCQFIQFLFDIGFNSGMKVHQHQKDDKCDTVFFFRKRKLNFYFNASKNSWKGFFFVAVVALMDHLD